MKLEKQIWLGQQLLPIVGELATNDILGCEALMRFANATPRPDQRELWHFVRRNVARLDASTWMLWAARWAHHGFPQVVLGHKLTAALMISEVVGETVPPSPWDAYIVLLPDGLLTTGHGAGAAVTSLDYLSVRHTGSGVELAIRARANDTMISAGMPRLTERVRPRDALQPSFGSRWQLAVTSEHLRAIELCSNLLLGVEIGLLGQELAAAASPPGKPRSYRVEAPVSADCRSIVRALSVGDSRAIPGVTFEVGRWQTDGTVWSYSAPRQVA